MNDGILTVQITSCLEMLKLIYGHRLMHGVTDTHFSSTYFTVYTGERKLVHVCSWSDPDPYSLLL